MITFSYSSLSVLHDHPHCWLNRMMGAQKAEWGFLKGGTMCHRIMQDHVSGKVPDKRLEWFQYKFPLVEEMDRDPKMNFKIQINDKYEVQGYFDGLNEDLKETLEGKFGTIWTIRMFQNSPQRKIYSLLRPDIKIQRILTGSIHPEDWETNRPKTYPIQPTQKDRDDAMEYILEGIKIFESGNFTSDLVDGKCTDPRCLYGRNCLFK